MSEGHVVNAVYARRTLGRHRGYRRGGVTSKGTDRLYIGLNAGTAA